MSIALMLIGYVLYAYATATGFAYNVTALNSALIPFINVSHDVASWLAVFAWIAGLTSTLGVLISAVNSQARLIFNAGREGLLPRWLGKVHPTRRTPMNAIYAFVGIATVIILVWALLHLVGGAKQSGQMSALNFFVDSSTMGTILVLVVYFLANLALPFYYHRYRPQDFNVVRHGVLPVLGLIAVGVPMYYLVKPGQSAPLNWFPYAALGVIVVSVIYAVWLSRRDPGLGDRVGSIIADE
jgi:amino acid transporter